MAVKTGTAGNDTLTGTTAVDQLYGLAGDDTLSAVDGNDLLEGGDGNDTLNGQIGNDTAYGGAGTDKLYGGVGDDFLYGGAGNDTIEGLDGNDLLYGGAGTDSVKGQNGNDTVFFSQSDGVTARGTFDGGGNVDVLRLDVTSATANSTAFQQQLGAYRAQIGASVFQTYDFTTLGFKAVQFETVEVRVNGAVYDAPVTANADSGATNEDTAFNLNVLANDISGDGIASLQILTQPSGGTAAVNADRTIRFTPGTSFQSLKEGATSQVGLTYRVTDTDGDAATATATITVTGRNDAPTGVTLAAGSHVRENLAGATIGKLAVTDVDVGDAFTYTLYDGRFEVVGGNLKLKAGNTLNHETAATVNVTVVGKDAAGASKTSVVTFAVDDANDAPTAIALAGPKTLQENAVGAIIGAVTVTDPDAGDSSTVVVNDSRFEVAGGNLRLKAGQFVSYESSKSLYLTLTATDEGGATKAQGFSIAIGNVQEAPATLTLSAAAVNENTGGAYIGNLYASDPDGTSTSGLTYSLGDNRFEVAGTALRVKAGINLDHEDEPVIPLAVTVTDNTGLKLTKTFNITVRDLNEAPTSIELANSDVLENTPGAVVGSVTALDPDLGDTPSVTVTDSRFEIRNGDLKLKDGVGLNYEATPTVTIALKATDDGGKVRTENVTIDVIDVFESGDDNDISLSSSEIPENVAGAVIGDLVAVDAQPGDVYTFATSDSRFEIVAGDQLKLKAGVSLDHENTASHLVSVSITNPDGLTHSEALQINVTDVNEAPTGITLSESLVPKNSPGTIIGSIGVVDPDFNETFTYSFSDDRFEIVSGQLKLKTGVSVTTNDPINLTIGATDHGGLATSQTFTIASSDAPPIMRVSVSATNVQANNASEHAAVSGDGDLVAFSSYAYNLVSGDTNAQEDVFVKDMVDGSIDRVSLTSTGGQANSASFESVIARDAAKVAFTSYASNIVAGDDNATSDVFLKTLGGSVIRISVAADGTDGNSFSDGASLNAAGTKVAFRSDADNLVAGDNNDYGGIFLKDVASGAVTMVDRTAGGIQGDGDASNPWLAAGANRVAFVTGASNFGGDTNGSDDVWVKDLDSGALIRASITASGGQGNRAALHPSLSADGHEVAFSSSATNFVGGDTNGASDIFVKDFDDGSLTRVSVTASGGQANGASYDAMISSDGTKVAFYSYASNLVSGDSNGVPDLFIKDLSSNTIIRASVGTAGAQANDSSTEAWLNADGTDVVFTTSASNLTPGDSNGADDIFIRHFDWGLVG